MKVPILGIAVDERFLNHRLRSSSIAGVSGGVLSTLLFAYRYFIGHVLSWDLLAVSLTIVVVKVAVLIWYRLTD
jgi:hypothetical protein